MLVKIRGCTFYAVAFAVFLWIFAKTQATHLEPDADVGDGGDMCQCGPRCTGYVEEHICARCCTSVMRRRRRSTKYSYFYHNYAVGIGKQPVTPELKLPMPIGNENIQSPRSSRTTTKSSIKMISSN